MASSSYSPAKWRTVSDFKYSSASQELDDELSYSARRRDNIHSPTNSQHVGISRSVRKEPHGSVNFQNLTSSVSHSSHDKLQNDNYEFGSQRNEYLKSSLGSRRLGLQLNDQPYSFGDEDEDLRLRLDLNTEQNYSSPRYESPLQLENTSGSKRLFSGKSEAEYRSEKHSLQSSVTPRGEIRHTTSENLRVNNGLDEEGAERFTDSASLHSSVRYSDEVNNRTRLTSLNGDQKYTSELRGDLLSLSPRVRSRELENLGSKNKFRKTVDLEAKNDTIPSTSIAVRNQDHSEVTLSNKKSMSSRSQLAVREDPLVRSRSYNQHEDDIFRTSHWPKDNPQSSESKSRMAENFEKFSGSRYSDLSTDMNSTKFKANYSHQMNLEKNKIGDKVSGRSETSPSRLPSHYSHEEDLDWDRNSKLKWNKDEELYGSQMRYSSTRSSDTISSRGMSLTNTGNELQLSSRSLRPLRPSDVEQKKSHIDEEFDHRDQNLRMSAGEDYNRKTMLNHDHRRSLLDSRSTDPDEHFGTMGRYQSKLHDVELGNLRQSVLLRDGTEKRKKSILLSKDNQIVNENMKAYENLGINSEFDSSGAKEAYLSKRKEVTFDFLTAGRSLTSPRHLCLMADVTGTKYKLVEQMIQMAGFLITDNRSADCSLIWNDSFVSLEKISALGTHQRINHFAAMGEICNKNSLVKNFARLMARFPKDYGFLPRSWVCPEDAERFQTVCKDLKKEGKKKIFITKPIIKSKETGVQLFMDAEKIPVSDHLVIQEYLKQPLLINRHKFHMRCFVLVTSCDPLHVYLYSDGIVYLASEPYIDASESKLDQLSVHITTDMNEKCSLHQLMEKLRQNRIDTVGLWKTITDIIIKTMILVHPHIYRNYKLCRFTKPKEAESVCFEILGFDFIIDGNINPWLLKVNQSPSFTISDDLDKKIKSGLLEDALHLISLSVQHSRPTVMTAELAGKALAELNSAVRDAIGLKLEEKELAEEEMKKQEIANILERIKLAAKAQRFGNSCGGYKQIFPTTDKNSLEKYLKLLESAHVFIPGPDDRRRQEIKQFLVQREKDRLQAVIRCGPRNDGSQNLSASKIVKIEIGEDLTARTLQALNETKINIPGKSEKAVAALIAKVHDNWKLHKPKVAEFWFVYLDSSKREKVINIVKNKVCIVSQSTWCTADVENVGLYRIFLRLFNRLLAHRGKGLWDCFHSKRNSWEVMFTKATDKIKPTEMSCCQRIVQLCCDCLCIVYICTPQQG